MKDPSGISSHESSYATRQDPRGLEEYVTLLRQASASSENPIYVTYLEGEKDELGLDIPSQKTISSIPYHFQTTGSIHPDSLGHLLDLLNGINPEDTFRVHGAALGNCPTEVATQLCGIAYAGQFWPDIPDFRRTEDNLAYRVDFHLRILRNANSLLTKFKIRLGVVHDTEGKLDLLLDPKYFKPDSIQMIDEKTRIVPYDQAEMLAKVAAVQFVLPPQLTVRKIA
ncbi:MAG: hypothetical protein ABH879_10940 [archaeon]